MDEQALRRIIDETVHQTLEKLGFTIDEPNAIQADMIYVRKARTGSEEVQKWVHRTAVGVAVTGALYTLWQGIRQAVQ